MHWEVQGSRVVHDDSSLRGSGPGRGIDKEWNKATGRSLGHSCSGALGQDGGRKGGADETFPRS